MKKNTSHRLLRKINSHDLISSSNSIKIDVASLMSQLQNQ